MRPRPLALLLVLAAGPLACASSAERVVEADNHLRYRNYGGALGAFRTVARDECPGKDQALCCRALIGEGDALVGLGERHGAVAAFERARRQCPQDLEVRRKLYLAQNPPDPDGAMPAATISFVVDHVLGRLGDRARIAWLAVFLDGELVGREPLPVSPGEHELEAEALVELRAPGGGPRRPVRLTARQALSVPGGRAGSGRLEAALRLTFAERDDLSLPEDRLIFQMELTAPPAPPAAAAAEDPGALARVLAQHVGIGLRLAGDPPKIPPELLRRGQGWKMRTELCVGPEGRVESVKFLEPAPGHDPRVDAAVLEALRRWRYGAYRVNDVLTRFCHALAVDLGARPSE